MRQEDLMQRPDLDSLAWVNPACQRFRLTGQDNLTVRTVSGQDCIRLLRCRTCGEEFSERRGTALFNTKITEAHAEDSINYLGAGCIDKRAQAPDHGLGTRCHEASPPRASASALHRCLRGL
jgi:hypothetical protein